MITDEIIQIIREKLIEALGKEEFEKKIKKIADILNDLDYKDVELPAEDIVELIKEILADKARKFHRMQWQVERAIERRLTMTERKKGKDSYVKVSTAERIWVLQRIKEMKSKKMKWYEIKDILKLDARSLIYNIVNGKMYATEIEKKLAKEIWSNLMHRTNYNKNSIYPRKPKEKIAF